MNKYENKYYYWIVIVHSYHCSKNILFSINDTKTMLFVVSIMDETKNGEKHYLKNSTVVQVKYLMYI